MNVTTIENVKKRLTQIYTYLQSLDQLRNPVKKLTDDQLWKLWFTDLPEYRNIESDFFELVKTADVVQRSVGTYLRVRRPMLTACPEPHETLLPWMKPGWQKIENEPELIEHEKDDDDEAGQLELFNDDEIRIQLFQDWLQERSEWKLKELPARETMKVFERLYALNATLEREQEQVELILGDGILNWTFSKSERISHPILLQKVKLTFDPSIPEFTVAPIEEGSMFYSALFRDVEEVRAITVKSCIEELEHSPCGPLDQQPTDEYLTRVASLLSSKGRFIRYGERMIQPNPHDPIILRNPVLFLRRRSLGFAQALERILNHLAETESLPEAVTRITGIDLGDDQSKDDQYVTTILDVNGEDEDIFFTKDANNDQLDIALKVRRYGSVLVQGPPGTGKTHTIANLIGHLLAEGKNILVTSHTSKALQVLRDKVVEPLQGLCVSVIQEEIGNQQMDQSIDIITERLSSMNPAKYSEEILRLDRYRKQLLVDIRRISRDLRTIRENEYMSIVFQGQPYTPLAAAKLVRDEEVLLSFIPGEVVLGAGLSLQEEEIVELYHSNKAISTAEELEISCLILHPEQLPNSTQFAEWVTEYNQLALSSKELHQSFFSPISTVEIELLQSLLQETLLHMGQYTAEENWKLAIISADNNENALTWRELVTEIDGLMESYAASKSTFYRYEISISSGNQNLLQLQDTMSEIIAYLKSGGKLNKMQFILHSKWSRAVKMVQVNGVPPVSLEHFEAIVTILKHQNHRSLLMRRWGRQVSAIGGLSIEALGNEPELLLPQLKVQLEQLLSWSETFRSNLLSRWEKNGLQWDKFMSLRKADLIPYAEWIHLKSMIETELPLIVESVINEWKWQLVQNRLVGLTTLISEHQSSAARTIDGLLQSVKHMDISAYTTYYNHLCDLWSKRDVWQQRNQLLSKLEEVAPDWANAIRKRAGKHGSAEVLIKPHRAWLIKQLEGELNRRWNMSPDLLQQELGRTREAFKQITVELVELKAWLALKQKTALEQQMALQGWKQQMKRVGKGTGAYAPLRLAEARKLMPVCQTAVPVWIMPISRVVESFDPAKNQFDVVIIDEASQADVMALTALYLGKQVIVVGDDNQISPVAVGQKQMEVQKLIETQLVDIPNASLYDGQISIYDLAQMSFSGVTQLREHFRCVEPIIQFSNTLSYKGSIKPLRDGSTVIRRPHTIAYRVEGVQVGKTNRVEAETIASLLIAASEQDSYSDATFGVISLLGEEQALLIDTYLQKHMDPIEYKNRKIRCGNSGQFQGDERDVMFLSMVYASEGNGPLSMLADPGEQQKKRYNVAASRARDQMWLVYSLNESVELKDGDLRKRLIQHMVNPIAAFEILKRAEPRIQSEFERQVMEQLLYEGFQVVSQWKVGAYSIDLVVEGGGKRIAIECDGERWHPIEKLGEDIARQTILERLGWTFFRIRGSSYFRNPDVTMQNVFRALESMGITRDLHKQVHTIPEENDSLKQQIVQRAEEIRRQWEAIQEEYPIKARGFRFRKDKNSDVEKVISSATVEDKSVAEQPATSFQLQSYLREKGQNFVDRRSQGGSLWVLGDRSISVILEPLAKHGYKFTFSSKGSRSTKHMPAWFTQN